MASLTPVVAQHQPVDSLPQPSSSRKRVRKTWVWIKNAPRDLIVNIVKVIVNAIFRGFYYIDWHVRLSGKLQDKYQELRTRIGQNSPIQSGSIVLQGAQQSNNKAIEKEVRTSLKIIEARVKKGGYKDIDSAPDSYRSLHQQYTELLPGAKGAQPQKSKRARRKTLKTGTGSPVLQRHLVRGLPNVGNTCYLNAILQCFFSSSYFAEMSQHAPDSDLKSILDDIYHSQQRRQTTHLRRHLKKLSYELNHSSLGRSIGFSGVGIQEDPMYAIQALAEIYGCNFPMRTTRNIGDRPSQMEEQVPYLNVSFGALSERINHDIQQISDSYRPMREYRTQQRKKGEKKNLVADIRRRRAEIEKISEKYKKTKTQKLLDKWRQLYSLNTEKCRQHEQLVREILPDEEFKALETSIRGNEGKVFQERLRRLRDELKAVPIQLLQEMVDHFFAPAAIEDYRVNDQLVNATEQRGLDRYPQVLPIRLIRAFGEGIKLNAGVDVGNGTIQVQGVPYRLSGFALHLGEGSRNGHYIAYVKSPGPTHPVYYCANDENVAQIKEEEFLRRSQKAFVYYFERIGSDPHQAASSSSHS